ncbi:MAG TPA: DUF2853 family protein [Saprospiraceae bacterium]|nr:DUF2853 family protein [Saprospiraceae bacterium]HPN68473.1 DUF2853 family protein [Saprospiraceae bacterium]
MIGESKVQNKKTLVNLSLYKKIIMSLGPSVFIDLDKPKSLKIEEELQNIKQKFLIDQLGLEDSPALDKKLDKITKIFLESNNFEDYGLPYFYYLLVIHFDSIDFFLKEKISNEKENDLSEPLLDFAKSLASRQKDIDQDIRRVTDENFFSLLL